MPQIRNLFGYLLV